MKRAKQVTYAESRAFLLAKIDKLRERIEALPVQADGMTWRHRGEIARLHQTLDPVIEKMDKEADTEV